MKLENFFFLFTYFEILAKFLLILMLPTVDIIIHLYKSQFFTRSNFWDHFNIQQDQNRLCSFQYPTSVWFLGFRLMKPKPETQKPNRTKYFLKYSNRFNQFFFIVQFFLLFFFQFFRFNRFFDFFVHL